MEPQTASENSNGGVALPQLNCELCRTRKIKCDKLQPCTACVSTGAHCVPVYRLRMPRGRHVLHQSRSSAAAVDDDLRRRVRRLEVLVNKANPRTRAIAVAAAATDPTSTDNTRSGTQTGLHVSALSIHGVAGGMQPVAMQHPDHFWADLADEIHGLRDVVESSPEEAEDDTVQTHNDASGHDVPPRYGFSVLGLSNLNMSLPVLNDTHTPILHDRALVAQLCHVYLQQVDPVVKILHRPSIAKHLVHGEGYLGYPRGHIAVEALDAAVLYVSVNSMTEGQCQRVLYKEKPGLLAECRRACEAAIERADLLTTRDMTVLQAFVLYLAGRHVEEQSRAVWTLLAVAVRVAKALSLNLEPSPTAAIRETFFVQQTRRQLWLTICLMDVQEALGMTSQPLIAMDEAVESYRLPRHVNDADFDPRTVHPPADRPGLTDTTYATNKYRLQHFGRLTNFGPPPSMAHSESGSNPTVAVRQKLADEFAKDMMACVSLCDPEQSPYAWLVFHSAQCFVAGARLSVLRPAHRVREEEAGKSSTDVSSPLSLPLAQPARPAARRTRGNPDLLRACTRVLEKAILTHTDPRGEGFRWAVTVRWHSLAIALTECYLLTNAGSSDTNDANNVDADLLRSVWPTIEASYQHHEAAIARYRGGKLRGPLGKLMASTRQKLEPILARQDHSDQQLQSPDSSIPIPETVNTTPCMDDGLWDPSWDAVWDDLVSGASFADDFASFDTQFLYE